MTMTVQQAIDYITNQRFNSIRPGLGRTQELLRRMNNPEKSLRYVHVAGSNGKGSTCVMIESVLRTAGYKTGFYLSPAVESFNETFQVDGETICDEELIEVVQEVRAAADAMEDHPSQFEMMTAAAFLYFKKKKCDIVVLETGMGGKEDSTNVIPAPEVAVITNIGLEHTDFLGDTLEKIASAKAGIIKTGADVVLYQNVPEVTEVIQKTCRDRGCRLFVTDPDREIRGMSKSLQGQEFIWNREGSMLRLRMPLLGNHQLRNAAVALTALESLKKSGFRISDRDIADGFAAVKWPVRFEVMSTEPVFIIDCSHNPQCVEALADMIREYLPGEKITLLMGVLADKDYRKMIELLEPYAAEYVCITPDSPRALPGKELAEILKERGHNSSFSDTIEKAVKKCLDSGRPTVTCTSLYISGEVRRAAAALLKPAGCTGDL